MKRAGRVTAHESGNWADIREASRRPDLALRFLLDPTGAPSGRADLIGQDYATVLSAELLQIFENMPCFSGGTLIATERGETPIEALRPDDLVLTRDHGPQPVVWVGKEHYGWRELGMIPVLKPVRIRRGALGDGLPERDLVVSPNHRLLVRRGGDEVLVSAWAFVGQPGVEVIAPIEINYHQLLLPRHEAVMANGFWSESLLATEGALSALSDANRAAARAALAGIGHQDVIRPARVFAQAAD